MFSRFAHTFAWGAAIVALSASVYAKPVDSAEIVERTERLPQRLEGVNVEEQLGALLPTQLSFVDDRSRDVLFDEVVRSGLPTIITFNYSDCPMLCSLQLNALVGGMKLMDLKLGQDYRIVTVALDPRETPSRARDTKARYLAQYGRPETEPEAWTVLTGSSANIGAVARAFGFTYNYNEKRDEYVHPAALSIVTPGGVIARYLYGLEYHPDTLRLSLIEASEGKVGSSLDRLILYCFHYDASEGRYAPMAMNIMRVSGGAGALALGGLLTGFWRAERKRNPASKTSS